MFKIFSNFSSRKDFCKHDLYELKKFVHEKPVAIGILLVNYWSRNKMSKR